MSLKNGTQKVFRISQEHNNRIFYYVVFAENKGAAIEKFNNADKDGEDIQIKELNDLGIGSNIYYVTNGPCQYGR